MRYYTILLLFLILGAGCKFNAASPKDREQFKRISQVSELIDKLGKDPAGFLLQTAGADELFVERIMLETCAGFLISNSDIALPLMFERLRKKEVPQGALLVYFFVFEKAKSAESIPYIADYVASASEEEIERCGDFPNRKGANFTYALLAANNIIYPPPPPPAFDITFPKFVDGKRPLFDQRSDIANQLRQWYKQ